MFRFPFLLLFVALTTAAFAQPDLEGRTLRVGSDTTYPPLEFVDASGAIVGYDVDLVNAACEILNCTAEFVTTAWDGIFPALAAGEFDLVASGVTITAERDETMDFSAPYVEVGQSITTRVEDDDLTLEDFQADGSPLTLGAQLGTTNADLGRELVGDDRLRLYDTFNGAVLALRNGDVDGVIIDDLSAGEFVQRYAGELVLTVGGLTSEPLGLAFPEGDPLADAFSEAIERLEADGTLDALYATWFGGTR